MYLEEKVDLVMVFSTALYVFLDKYFKSYDGCRFKPNVYGYGPPDTIILRYAYVESGIYTVIYLTLCNLLYFCCCLFIIHWKNQVPIEVQSSAAVEAIDNACEYPIVIDHQL